MNTSRHNLLYFHEKYIIDEHSFPGAKAAYIKAVEQTSHLELSAKVLKIINNMTEAAETGRYTHTSSERKLDLLKALNKWLISENSNFQDKDSLKYVVALCVAVSNIKRHSWSIFSSPHSSKELKDLLKEKGLEHLHDNDFKFNQEDLSKIQIPINAKEIIIIKALIQQNRSVMHR